MDFSFTPHFTVQVTVIGINTALEFFPYSIFCISNHVHFALNNSYFQASGVYPDRLICTPCTFFLCSHFGSDNVSCATSSPK